ncbi:transposase [Streptomyces ambofaciens]
MDRGKPGSMMHILSDTNGLPLLVGVSAGNTHDSEGMKPMVEGHQTRHDPHRGRYFKPQRLHADKAYDRADLRRWLRGKRIGVRGARKGIESSERLGRRRWVIERTMSWLSGYRRLSPRYERNPRNYRPCRRPLPLQATHPPHHVGHGRSVGLNWRVVWRVVGPRSISRLVSRDPVCVSSSCYWRVF